MTLMNLPLLAPIFPDALRTKLKKKELLKLLRRLTSYGECAGGCDGRYRVGSYTFIDSIITFVGPDDHEKLPAIRMGDETEPVVHLQGLPIWKTKHQLIKNSFQIKPQ